MLAELICLPSVPTDSTSTRRQSHEHDDIAVAHLVVITDSYVSLLRLLGLRDLGTHTISTLNEGVVGG